MNMSSTSLVIELRRLQLSLISTSFGVNSPTLFPGIFRYENPWERGCLYPINLFENCCVFYSTPLIFSASSCHLTEKTTFDLMWFDIVQYRNCMNSSLKARRIYHPLNYHQENLLRISSGYFKFPSYFITAERNSGIFSSIQVRHKENNGQISTQWQSIELFWFSARP